MSLSISSYPVQSLCGNFYTPADKSISHRAIILGALANGQSNVKNFLLSEDCLHTLNAFKNLGINIEKNNDEILINGCGLYGLQAPEDPIYCGNSGTLMRLLAGVLAGQPFKTILLGDESLSKRPMQRISIPLNNMGANINTTENTAPIIISGSTLHGLQYKMPVPSAQVKSSILFAGLYAKDTTTIIENIKTRDHTELMFKTFNINLHKENNSIVLKNFAQDFNGQEITVPGDLSSAAFAIVATLITKDSEIVIKNVGINPTRTGLLTILEQMGAQIYLENKRMYGYEPVADLRIKSSKLQGIEIDEKLVSLAIDEFPVVFIAAACAKGKSIIKDAAELRTKETDRIAAMVKGLRELGIDVNETRDGAIITGGQIQGGIVDSFGDHRIAMAFAVAGTCAKDSIKILNCENISTSFPDFVTKMCELNLQIQYH